MVIRAHARIFSAVLFAVCAAGCNSAGTGGAGGQAGSGGTSLGGGGTVSTAAGGSASGGVGAGGVRSGTGGSVASGGAPGSGGAPTGGAAGSGVVTSFPGSAPLGGLTPEEATQLCRDTHAYYAKAIELQTLCKWTGLAYGVSSSASSDSQLQQNCAGQESICMDAGPASPKCSTIPESCTATVEQYSTCIVDRAAAFSRGVDDLAGCATVTLPDLDQVWDFVIADLPESCAVVTKKCPSVDIPTPQAGTSSSKGGSGGSAGTGGAGGAAGGAGGTAEVGGSGGSAGGSGGNTQAGGSGGSTGGTTNGTGGTAGTTGMGGSTSASTLPGDVAKAAGTPFVAAHAMTRALFASYTGPLFKALRDSDKQEKDIGVIASTGLVDLATLQSFCSGTTCKVTTLYDQSGNGNDMWRADDPNTNQPGTKRPCDLMAIDYWQLSDGTKIPVVVETGGMWKETAQCLRNRDKTKNMPTGAKPQTTYAIFHAKYLNNNCCFNYGNTGNAVHYTGPGTLSALNFSKIEFWSKGTGSGPWVMVDWEQGVYAGNIAKCGSGAAPTADCTTTGENPNPSVTFDVVTTLFKHDGVNHWALKHGNAKAGTLAISIDLPTLPKGYSPLKQEGGLGLGEGGAGDPNGTGGFSEGAVMAGETTDETDNAIQKSIVSVYGK